MLQVWHTLLAARAGALLAMFWPGANCVGAISFRADLDADELQRDDTNFGGSVAKVAVATSVRRENFSYPSRWF